MRVLGQTQSGRYLKVIIRDHGDGTGFVLTALEMVDSERRMFKRRR